MLPQTTDQILAHFRKEPITKNLQEFVRRNAFEHQYLFIREKGAATGYCSFCQKDIPLKDRASMPHNTDTTCPRCHHEVTVKHVWRGIKGIADVAYVYHFARSVKNKQMVTCQTFYVYRFLEGKPETMEYSPSCYYIFSDEGSKMMYVYPYSRAYCLTKSVYIKNPSGDFYQHWRGKISANLDSLAQAICNTPFQYSAWEKYIDMAEKILLYIAQFAKYPQLEYLSKCGLNAFIQSYLERYPVTRGLLNWRGNSLRKVLGFQPTKQELQYIDKKSLSGVTLANWIALRKSGCPVLLPDLHHYGWLTEVDALNKLRETVSFNKLLTYQKRLEKRGELTAYFFRDYSDYLRECRQLGHDLSRKDILYPKSWLKNICKISCELNKKQTDSLIKNLPNDISNWWKNISIPQLIFALSFPEYQVISLQKVITCVTASVVISTVMPTD